MSKITVTTIAGQTSGADANTVKIESGDDFIVDTSVLKVDATNNRVGVGTASPTSDLHVSGGAGAHVAIQSSAGSHWRLGDAVGSSNGIFVVRDHTNSANRIQILADGKTQIAQGITFGSDTAAANTLDDYEEGTWTPIWRVTGGANSFNYTIQTGRYTKIGNRVFGLGRVSSSGHSGSGGGVSIQGFPFTSTNVTTAYHHFTFGHLTGFSYTGVPYGYVNSNTIYSDLQVNNNGSISALVYPSSAAIDIIFQFMYETDA